MQIKQKLHLQIIHISSSFNTLDQPFSQFQSIHRPEAFWSRAVDAGMSGLGAAVQDPVDPLGGYGVQAEH